MPFRSAVLVFVSLPLVNTLLWGQGATTSLHGIVTDYTGATIANAKVTIINRECSYERSTNTGPEGGYEFLQLTPSTYSITVEMGGFRKFEQKDIQLLVNTPASANVALDVDATTATVELPPKALS